MNFKNSNPINYDPHHIISQRRKLNKNREFEHQVVEGLAEKDSWMDYQIEMNNVDALQENPYSLMKSTTIIILTPRKVEMDGKRAHSEAMEIEEEDSETRKRKRIEKEG